jgi:hypothetical protein
MQALGVAPETVRTWRKRGAVPLSQIKKAASVSDCPIDWFTTNQPTEIQEKFFIQKEKQISRTSGVNSLGSEISGEVLTYVMTMVDEELGRMALDLPPSKKAQLVTVLYQRFVERANAGASITGDTETVRQYLRLVA